MDIAIEGNRNLDIIGCTTIAEVVPGWVLVQAHTANSMFQGQYGLHRPTGGSPYDDEVEFKFPAGLKFLDDQRDVPDEDLKELDTEFWKSLEQLERLMVCTIENGHYLYEACRAGGYDPDRDGARISYWLSQRIGDAIAAHERA